MLKSVYKSYTYRSRKFKNSKYKMTLVRKNVAGPEFRHTKVFFLEYSISDFEI
jgi:hypothetical protein